MSTLRLPEREVLVDQPGRPPLIVGIYGKPGCGKTYSALRLATGMSEVLKEDIVVIDTEGLRAKSYKKYFKFKHIDFQAPFGPLHYQRFIETAANYGKIIVVDSMSHEHDGDGGYLDLVEMVAMERAEQSAKRYNKAVEPDKFKQLAYAAISRERKSLTQRIIQMGRDGVVFIFCYRAKEKRDSKTLESLGQIPISTSELIYEMNQCFLLKAQEKRGCPATAGTTEAEWVVMKTPRQYEGWNKGEQLDEALGKRLALSVVGQEEIPSVQAAPAADSWQSDYDALSAEVSKAVEGTKVDPKDVIRHVLSWGVTRGMTDQPEKLTAKTVGSRVAQLFKEVPEDVLAEVVGFVDLMTVASDA